MNNLSKITITAIVIASLAVGGVWYVNNDGGDVIDGGASDQGETRERAIPMIYFGANVDSPPTYERDVIPRASWSYTPTANISGVSFAISGTATSWLSLTNGVISGTVPDYDTSASPTNTYTLVVTASTTQPTQTATQTITFNVLGSVSFQLGANVTGTLVFNTGVLDITGTGEMYTFSTTFETSEHGNSPIESYADEIYHIVIGDGVTSIGKGFGSPSPGGLESYVKNVVTVSGGKDIVNIYENGFAGLGYASNCQVDWLEFENLERIGKNAFASATLRTVILPDTVTTIETLAFQHAKWITLIIGNGLTTIGEHAFWLQMGDTSADIVFYESDGTTVISGTDIKGGVYIKTNTTDGTCTSCLSGSVTNSTYSNDYVYLVSGKSVPNKMNGSVVSADNVTITTTISNETTLNNRIPVFLTAMKNATLTYTLSSSIGTATIGSSAYNGDTSFTSGTAPLVFTPTTLSSNAIATATVTDGASVTLSTDFGLDFHALVVPVLEFTSTPSS